MNLSDMITFVRDQAQTDAEDAPDSLLTVYARAAYNDIQARVYPWPSKRETFTFNSVAGTAFYAFAAMTPPNLDFVVTVRSADEHLGVLHQEHYEELVTEATSSGTPSMFALSDAGGLYLYPTPSAAKQYTVEGYRTFRDWPAVGGEPDLPRGFDEPIVWYMMSRYYKSQEDLELAADYMRDYETAVARQIESALRSSKTTAGPRIFGGDPQHDLSMSYSSWVKRGVEG